MTESGENVICQVCGMAMPAEYNFCEKCGAMLTSADPNEIDYYNGGSE